MEKTGGYVCKLSVCITNYNEKQYIEEAIESVLNQRLKSSYEVLIGDDGSDDGSYELIQEKYGQLSNVRIFRQERDNNVKEYPNFRHARLILRLIKEVKGEYFSILDGDDFYTDMDGFQRKINILDDPENQDCICCMSNMERLINGEQYVEVKNNLSVKSDLRESVFRGKDPYIHLGTAVIRSSVISHVKNRYTTDWADGSITRWLMYFGKRYYDEHITFCYRIRDDGIFRTNNETLNYLRAIISIDWQVDEWNGKYRFEYLKAFKHCYHYLWKNRNNLNVNVDYSIWLPLAKQYNGYAWKIMDYDSLGGKEKFSLIPVMIFVFINIIEGFIRTMNGVLTRYMCFIVNSEIGMEEKREIIVKKICKWAKILKQKIG